MASNKLARKTATESATVPALVPRPNGHGALLTGGQPGNKGGGRTPDEFKARMVEIASSAEALAYLDQCIKGVHGPKAAASARVYATEHGYGKVPNAVELSGPNSSPIPVAMTIRLVRPDAGDNG